MKIRRAGTACEIGGWREIHAHLANVSSSAVNAVSFSCGTGVRYGFLYSRSTSRSSVLSLRLSRSNRLSRSIALSLDRLLDRDHSRDGALDEGPLRLETGLFRRYSPSSISIRSEYRLALGPAAGSYPATGVPGKLDIGAERLQSGALTQL